MALGADLSAFGDFFLTQGPAFLTGAESVINLASKRTFTLSRLIAGKNLSEMIQGGSKIKDQILFNAKSDYKHYKPNQSFDYTNPQVLTEWEIDWRFTMDDMQWTDHEVGLNVGEMSRAAKIHKFKTLKRVKEMNLMTSLMNNMDAELWAQPNATTMEGTAGTAPYSIPVFINEYSSDSGSLPGHGAGWTNVMSIDPDPTAGEVKWQNLQFGYADSKSATGDVFKTLSKAFYKLHYDRLPRRPELGEASTWPNFIATSLWGLTNYEHQLRIGQDSFYAGKQDPAFPTPTFRGVPLVYIQEFDTAPIFRTGAADTWGVETSNANGAGSGYYAGPRFMVITGQYLVMVFHSERYFWKKSLDLDAQPFNHVVVVDIWHNLVCRARNRHAILYPTADQT